MFLFWAEPDILFLSVHASPANEEANVVAAIIIPLNDTYVQHKSIIAKDGLAFTLRRESDSGAVVFRTIGFGCMIRAIEIGSFFSVSLKRALPVMALR